MTIDINIIPQDYSDLLIRDSDLPYRERVALLDPVLQPYAEHEGGELGWDMLRSPLVFQLPFTSPHLANESLRIKVGMLQKALDTGNRESIIGIHERPFRLQAYIEYLHDSKRGETVWSQTERVQDSLMGVWTDSENIGQHRMAWDMLWNPKSRERAKGTVLGDQEWFDTLPDRITVFRGGAPTESFISWTTEPKTAEFFSKRSGYPVRRATIHKGSVFAALTQRGEWELLSYSGRDSAR